MPNQAAGLNNVISQVKFQLHGRLRITGEQNPGVKWTEETPEQGEQWEFETFDPENMSPFSFGMNYYLDLELDSTLVMDKKSIIAVISGEKVRPGTAIFKIVARSKEDRDFPQSFVEKISRSEYDLWRVVRILNGREEEDPKVMKNHFTVTLSAADLEMLVKYDNSRMIASVNFDQPGANVVFKRKSRLEEQVRAIRDSRLPGTPRAERPSLSHYNGLRRSRHSSPTDDREGSRNNSLLVPLLPPGGSEGASGASGGASVIVRRNSVAGVNNGSIMDTGNDTVHMSSFAETLARNNSEMERLREGFSGLSTESSIDKKFKQMEEQMRRQKNASDQQFQELMDKLREARNEAEKISDWRRELNISLESLKEELIEETEETVRNVKETVVHQMEQIRMENLKMMQLSSGHFNKLEGLIRTIKSARAEEVAEPPAPSPAPPTYVEPVRPDAEQTMLNHYRHTPSIFSDNLYPTLSLSRERDNLAGNLTPRGDAARQEDRQEQTGGAQPADTQGAGEVVQSGGAIPKTTNPASQSVEAAVLRQEDRSKEITNTYVDPIRNFFPAEFRVFRHQLKEGDRIGIYDTKIRSYTLGNITRFFHGGLEVKSISGNCLLNPYDVILGKIPEQSQSGWQEVLEYAEKATTDYLRKVTQSATGGGKKSKKSETTSGFLSSTEEKEKEENEEVQTRAAARSAFQKSLNDIQGEYDVAVRDQSIHGMTRVGALIKVLTSIYSSKNSWGFSDKDDIKARLSSITLKASNAADEIKRQLNPPEADMITMQAFIKDELNNHELTRWLQELNAAVANSVRS